MIDTILDLFVYAVFPYFKRKKWRQEEWFGVVEERRYVSEELFDKYEEGKQYYKKSGEDLPGPLA